MAKGRKTGGKDWVKGCQSPYPAGRPVIPEEIKIAKEMNQIELQRILNKLIHLSEDELEIHLKNPEATVFELSIGAVIKKAVQQGDQSRINFLLDRLVGKAKESLEVTNPDGNGFRVIVQDYTTKK